MKKNAKNKVNIVPEVKVICRDIKNLEIQGARNVAIMGLSAFVIEGLSFRDANATKMKVHLKKTSQFIKSLRSTEPMLFNFLDALLSKISKNKDTANIKRVLYISHKKIENLMRSNKLLIAKNTYKLIKNNDIILTHCHSSTVVESLIYAKSKGKKFKVYATETRPRWQGHKTVKALAAAGINVTLIPDGAFAPVLRDYKIKKILLGADAVDSKGCFANKVGSLAIAEVSKNYKIPVYVLTELYKYDKRPKIIVEHRDAEELVNTSLFKNVSILNLAFDIVPGKFVKKYVTETGMISYNKFACTAKKQLKKLLD